MLIRRRFCSVIVAVVVAFVTAWYAPCAVAAPHAQSPEEDKNPPARPTGEIVPTSTPIEEVACQVTRLDVVRDNDTDDWTNASWSLDQVVRGLDTIPEGFECVKTKIESAVACAEKRMKQGYTSYYGDDGIAYCFANPIFGDLSWQGIKHRNVYYSCDVPEAERNKLIAEKKAYCARKSAIHPDFGINSGMTPQCVTGHIYLTEKCKLVELDSEGNPKDPDLRVCGNPSLHFTKSSPLSLVWEAGADSNVEVSFSRFPLDSSGSGELYTWKGSSALPLVVYDPEHTGIITRADQLFGNWTFGGQKVAALAGDVAPQPKPWRDGYEALATLDVDGDGKVRGEELTPLGLWFDGNRNGISEAGEVQPLRAAGVTALFYNSDSFDSVTQTVRASKGFERDVNGDTIRGASIDWFGGSGGSSINLTQALLARHRSESSGSVKEPSPSVPHDATAAKGATFAPSPWVGVWEWRLESDASRKVPDGYLLIGLVKGGGVKGMTVAPTYMRPSRGDSAVMLASYEFEGEFEGDGAGQVLTFTTQAGYSKIVSKVTLDPKDGSLRGESRATTSNGTEKIRYTWIARRK